MKTLKNVLILMTVLVLSYLSASWFGSFYDKFSPQYSNSFLGTSKDLSIFVAGIPVAYVFFTPFWFELLGSENRRKWVIWLLVPPALMWISADRYYIYLPIILGLAGFTLAFIIRKIISKLRRPNPPVVN